MNDFIKNENQKNCSTFKPKKIETEKVRLCTPSDKNNQNNFDLIRIKSEIVEDEFENKNLEESVDKNNSVDTEDAKIFDKKVVPIITLSRIDDELIIKDEIKEENNDGSSNIVIRDATKSTLSQTEVAKAEIQEVNKEIEVDVIWAGLDEEFDPLQIGISVEEKVFPLTKRKNGSNGPKIRKYQKILPDDLKTLPEDPKDIAMYLAKDIEANSEKYRNELNSNVKSFYIHDNGKIVAKISEETNIKNKNRITMQTLPQINQDVPIRTSLNNVSIENLPILLIGQDGNILPTSNRINSQKMTNLDSLLAIGQNNNVLPTVVSQNVTTGQFLDIQHNVFSNFAGQIGVQKCITNTQVINTGKQISNSGSLNAATMNQILNFGQQEVSVNQSGEKNFALGPTSMILNHETANMGAQMSNSGHQIPNLRPQVANLGPQMANIELEMTNLEQKIDPSSSASQIDQNITGRELISASQGSLMGPTLSFGQNGNGLPTVVYQISGIPSQNPALIASSLDQGSFMTLGQNNLPNGVKLIVLDPNMQVSDTVGQVFNQNLRETQPMVVIGQGVIPSITSQSSIDINQGFIDSNLTSATGQNSRLKRSADLYTGNNKESTSTQNMSECAITLNISSSKADMISRFPTKNDYYRYLMDLQKNSNPKIKKMEEIKEIKITTMKIEKAKYKWKALHPFGKSGLTNKNIKKYYKYLKKEFRISDDVPYPNFCDVCKKTFTISNYLMDHFNKFHKASDDDDISNTND